jgi:predicted Fe-Mo cluster-binding NifX family protein
MKIAAVTDDGQTISQHFGRAQQYAVLTIEDGKIVARETRDKWAHSHHGEHSHETHGPDTFGHGLEPGAQETHARMATPIVDCQAVLARGMGSGAYNSLRQAGIKPVVTEISSIDEAALAYAAGTLVDHTEWLH